MFQKNAKHQVNAGNRYTYVHHLLKYLDISRSAIPCRPHEPAIAWHRCNFPTLTKALGYSKKIPHKTHSWTRCFYKKSNQTHTAWHHFSFTTKTKYLLHLLLFWMWFARLYGLLSKIESECKLDTLAFVMFLDHTEVSLN